MAGLERRIEGLRAAVRQAVIARDPARARALRAELRSAEKVWDQALQDLETGTAAEAAAAGSGGVRVGAGTSAGPSLLPLREQVHHALTLLAVPAAPKLIVEVHAAFLGPRAGTLTPARLTHLRRDEERSYRTTGGARPYFLCSALTAAHLAPARGLLAVSSWPLERRIIGPLSPRVDFLTAAIRVAKQAARVPAGNGRLDRLLRRFAANIPGAADRPDSVDPKTMVKAARAELEVHTAADRSQRQAAADRARTQLDEIDQLFGLRLETA